MSASGQGAPILQDALPFTPWADPALSRLPGMKPVEGSWIVVDEAYGAQMAERARLLATRRDAVLQSLPGSEAAEAELLAHVLGALPPAFRVEGATVTCSDGRVVPTDGAPLAVLSTLLQEDLLILQKRGDEHVLTAGLLCFPASWTLAEKIGRPLTRIHAPVPCYAGAVAGRVQRLFDRVPAGRAMWRCNALGYADPDLHHPRVETAPHRSEAPRYLRCERQSVLRLPGTGAIVFAVHTYVLRPEALTPAQRAGCPIRFAGQGAAKCLESFSP